MKPYRLRPHRTALQPGIDAGSFNRLVDELETEAALPKLVAREGKARRR